MRLQQVTRGQGIKRLLFPIMGWKIGTRLPDVVRAILYRPKLFGKPYNAWIQAAMRGPSPWSVWERELFAAITSRCNECVF